MNKNELVDYISFNDIVDHNPGSDPYVPLYSHVNYHYVEWPLQTDIDLLSHRSVIVNTDSKEKALKEIEYQDIFPDNGCVGVPFTLGEQDDLLVEPLWFCRYWSGLEIESHEPSQKLIHSLKLIKNIDKPNEWIDPYKNTLVLRVVKKEESFNDGKKLNEEKIEIKLDYLKSFLLKSRAGLLIIRYARRTPIFHSKADVPKRISSHKKVKHYGKMSWHTSLNNDVLAHLAPAGKELGQAELNQKFWVEPAKTKKSVCVFVLSDGSKEEYKDSQTDYFKLISFNLKVLELFNSKQNYDFKENSRDTINLLFPNGSSLLVGINESGHQLQAWWGNIVKIPLTYQKELSPYSEAWKKKMNPQHEYVRITINGDWDSTEPRSITLQKLKSSINKYFIDKCGESYFNQVDLSKKKVFYMPYNNTYEQLFKIMNLIDAWLLESKLPKKLNDYFGLRCNDNEECHNSLKSLNLLLGEFDCDAEKIKVFSSIKEFRHCDAHPEKDYRKVIKDFNFDGFSPLEIYNKIIFDLEHTLKWFLSLCSDNKFYIAPQVQRGDVG